ncbi:MAG: redox-sensing transcriptional repressor Rex [Bacteroidales bacterium]|nr:redox-sensing transcriptional repressor Rex [Bacteroidales bacterium]
MKQVTKYVIKNNLKRLFTYRICLVNFKRKGFDRVFSYNLGEEAGVTAEQVRKDFSEFNIRGNKKGGYSIGELLHAIDDIFKFQRNEHVILIGMGNIGRALVQYKRFILRKMIIVASFDIDPSKQSKRWGIPVLSLEQMDDIIRKFHVRTAIVAVPEISAQEICNKLVKLGIKGILNFAPIVPKVPHDVVVNNINLCDELESVIYYVDKQGEDL